MIKVSLALCHGVYPIIPRRDLWICMFPWFHMKVNFKTLPPSLTPLWVHWHWQVHACSFWETMSVQAGIWYEWSDQICFIAIYLEKCVYLCVKMQHQVGINVCDMYLYAKYVDMCNLCLSWLCVHGFSWRVWEQVCACLHAPPLCVLKGGNTL